MTKKTRIRNLTTNQISEIIVKYTVKNKDEALGHVEASSKVEAEILASARKRLTLEKFLKIYEVKKA